MDINPLKIVLISSGQPSLNPRLVKEADTLANAGYEVTVIYAYWNKWGTELDRQLIASKKWKAVRAGGGPENETTTYFISRIIYKFSGFVNARVYPGLLSDYAIARSSYFLAKAALKHKADLYIAHNLGALPAAVKAAMKNGRFCGFDAEDFHRYEASDNENDPAVKLKTTIENKYIPKTDYMTASSSLITNAYKKLYPSVSPVTILNVFPADLRVKEPMEVFTGNLKLFWFSQTIGPNRGLELVIDAIKLTGLPIEFHLLGDVVPGYKQQLTEQMRGAGPVNASLYFYGPIPADDIFPLAAKFDIGVASEPGFSFNNKIALSNKLFTYIQCGLAVVASDTPAQSAFIDDYPDIGITYSDAGGLASILTQYHQNRDRLFKTRIKSFQIGRTALNWDRESKKFLSVVQTVLKTVE